MAHRTIINEMSYFGEGAVLRIAGEIRNRGLKKALVVTDKDLIRFKVATRVTDQLEQAGIAYGVFDDVHPNPTIANVLDCLAKCRAEGADVLVAVGGGSAIDTSKAVGIIAANPEFSDVRSLEGARTRNKSVPVIAVSTTAGSGAEVTTVYVISDEENKRKFVCADPNAIPAVAIVDPDMMSSMPRGLTAATGMDALTHAIEAYLTRDAWELTDSLAIKAIEIISRSLRSAVKGGPNGRKDMALGQYMAAMAFSNAGLGITHSMAHALGALYNTPHGVANAILLPGVMAYNADVSGSRYARIAKAMGVPGAEDMSADEYRRAAIDAVKLLNADIGIPPRLREVGAQEEDIPFLAAAAMEDFCLPGNPKTPTQEDIESLYRSML